MSDPRLVAFLKSRHGTAGPSQEAEGKVAQEQRHPELAQREPEDMMGPPSLQDSDTEEKLDSEVSQRTEACKRRSAQGKAAFSRCQDRF